MARGVATRCSNSGLLALAQRPLVLIVAALVLGLVGLIAAELKVWATRQLEPTPTAAKRLAFKC